MHLLLICLLSICFISFTDGLSKNINELNYNIIATFQTPGPRSQGLAFDGIFLWLSDDSTDQIYKINCLNGTVLNSFSSPGPTPKDLTFDGTYLWNIDDNLKKIFKLNLENGSIISFFDSPMQSYPNRGLCWDGNYLWMSYLAGWSSSVARIDTCTGIIDTSFFCSAVGLNFDGTYLWTVDSQEGLYKGFVQKREIPSGNEIDYFRTPGFFPTSLCYDGSFFWHIDMERDTLYQIQLDISSLDDYGNKKEYAENIYLYQNYPNPFNPITQITYSITKMVKVEIIVFDILGREVAKLVNETKKAGKHEVVFDASNYSSGLYFYKLKIEDRFIQIRKMLLMK